jgi:hypothetical protein
LETNELSIPRENVISLFDESMKKKDKLYALSDVSVTRLEVVDVKTQPSKETCGKSLKKAPHKNHHQNITLNSNITSLSGGPSSSPGQDVVCSSAPHQSIHQEGTREAASNSVSPSSRGDARVSSSVMNGTSGPCRNEYTENADCTNVVIANAVLVDDDDVFTAQLVLASNQDSSESHPRRIGTIKLYLLRIVALSILCGLATTGVVLIVQRMKSSPSSNTFTNTKKTIVQEDSPTESLINDACEHATKITSFPKTFKHSTLGTSPDMSDFDDGMPVCNGMDLNTHTGLWYKVIGSYEWIRFEYHLFSKGDDSELSIFTGSCGNLVCVSDETNRTSSHYEIYVDDWQKPYWVLLHGANFQTDDTYEFKITTPYGSFSEAKSDASKHFPIYNWVTGIGVMIIIFVGI